MADPKPKVAGVLSDESLHGLRRLMRKFGYYSSREDVWHAVDTAFHWRGRAHDLEERLAKSQTVSAARMARICELEAEVEIKREYEVGNPFFLNAHTVRWVLDNQPDIDAVKGELGAIRTLAREVRTTEAQLIGYAMEELLGLDQNFEDVPDELKPPSEEDIL